METKNFLSLQSPYIHSHSINFRLALKDISGVSVATDYTSEAFEKNLTRLGKIADFLEKQTNDFLRAAGFNSVEAFNKALFGSADYNDEYTVFSRAMAHPMFVNAILKQTFKTDKIKDWLQKSKKFHNSAEKYFGEQIVLNMN